MRIQTAIKKNPSLINALLDVWEESVSNEHLSLSPDDFQAMKPTVKAALESASPLIYATNAYGVPVGFMRINHGKIEMLFIVPSCQGKGLGRRFIRYAGELGIHHADICMRNKRGIEFYQRMGFQPLTELALEEEADMIPIFHLRREPEGKKARFTA